MYACVLRSPGRGWACPTAMGGAWNRGDGPRPSSLMLGAGSQPHAVSRWPSGPEAVPSWTGEWGGASRAALAASVPFVCLLGIRRAESLETPVRGHLCAKGGLEAGLVQIHDRSSSVSLAGEHHWHSAESTDSGCVLAFAKQSSLRAQGGGLSCGSPPGPPLCGCMCLSGIPGQRL